MKLLALLFTVSSNLILAEDIDGSASAVELAYARY